MHWRFPAGRAVAATATLLMLAVAPAVAPAVPASAATCSPGFPAQPQNPGLFANILTGSAVFSRCDAWAVGYTNGSRVASLAEHWNGRKWKVVPVPDGGGVIHDNWLSAVAGSSGTNVWAVGKYDGGTSLGDFLTLILHWDGSSWQQVPSKNPEWRGRHLGEQRLGGGQLQQRHHQADPDRALERHEMEGAA